MPHVLFLCSGNYYRSRFAEHLFNALAEAAGSEWRAESRGLKLSGTNPGPISRHTVAELATHGVATPDSPRWPQLAVDEDFRRAALVVALKEAEHRPLMEERFPAHVARVEFWHIHDQDVTVPAVALPELAAAVRELVERLGKGER